MIPFGANDFRLLEQKSQLIGKDGDFYLRFSLDMTSLCLECYSIYNKGKIITIDAPFKIYHLSDYILNKTDTKCSSCNSKKVIQCDNLIVDSIAKLNKSGFTTTCCCSGHTGKVLDHSDIIIYPTYIVFDLDEIERNKLFNCYESNRCNIKNYFDLLYKFGTDDTAFGYEALFGEKCVIISKDKTSDNVINDHINSTNYLSLVGRMYSSYTFRRVKCIKEADKIIKERCKILNKFTSELVK